MCCDCPGVLGGGADALARGGLLISSGNWSPPRRPLLTKGVMLRLSV